MVLCMQSKLQQQQLERERALLHLRPSCQRLGGYNAAWWLQTATHVHNLGKGSKIWVTLLGDLHHKVLPVDCALWWGSSSCCGGTCG